LTLDGILPVSGVYMIENTRNGKKYVGSSKNIKNRIRDHIHNLEKGKHHSVKLQRGYTSLEDKSVFVASIIEEVPNISLLLEREQYYIDYYDAYNTGYNCASKTDNPQYTKKNLAKAQKKKEITELYAHFDEMYDFETHLFSFTVGQNIISRHYKKPTISSIVTIMRWFDENYKKKIHKIRFRWYFDMLCPVVLDEEDRPFAVYVYRKNQVYLSESDTDIMLRHLTENNQFEKGVHYAVKQIEPFDWESFIGKRHGDLFYRSLKSKTEIDDGMPILLDSIITDKYRNFMARVSE